MGVLAKYLKSEATELQQGTRRRKETVEEWLTSIDALFEQLKQWLATADGGLGLLQSHTRDRILIQESKLGSYWCEKLTISMGEEPRGWVPIVEVVPRARHVLAEIVPAGSNGAAIRVDGHVEIRERNFTTMHLFRLKGYGEYEWYSVPAVNGNDREYRPDAQPLTADTFESVVLSALK